MTEDNQYTPPPGVLVPDAAIPPAPPPGQFPQPGQYPQPGQFPQSNLGPTQEARGFATAAIALTGAYTLLGVVGALLAQGTVDRTREAIDNPGSGSGLGIDTAISSLGSLVGIAAFVFLALWMARIRANRTALGETPGGPPAVEWWGWFVPVANFVLPLLGMRAISRRLVGWGLLLGWWLPFCVVWLIFPISSTAGFRAVDFSTGEITHPEVLDSLVSLSYVSAAALLLSWLFLVPIIRRTTVRHLNPAAAA